MPQGGTVAEVNIMYMYIIGTSQFARAPIPEPRTARFLQDDVTWTPTNLISLIAHLNLTRATPPQLPSIRYSTGSHDITSLLRPFSEFHPQWPLTRASGYASAIFLFLAGFHKSRFPMGHETFGCRRH